MKAQGPRVWGELTSPEAAELVASDPVFLWTVSATEQHGPHLPLATDALIGAGLAAEAERRLPPDFPLVCLPPLEVGSSLEHEGFPGPLSVPADLLAAWVVRVGQGVAAAGGRRLVILNSHGGNRYVLEGAALRLRAEAGLLVIPLHYPRLGRPPSVDLPEEEWRYGLHGGAVETALMLHLRPDLVRTELIPSGATLARELDDLLEVVSAEGAAGFAWLAADLNPVGVTGEAALADPDMGRRLLEFWGEGVATVIRDARAFPLERLQGRRGVDRVGMNHLPHHSPILASPDPDPGPGPVGDPYADPHTDTSAPDLSDLFAPLMDRERVVVGQLGQGLDGRIATEEGHSHYVTGQEDLVRLHRLRALVDAVLVGAGTALADDPRLTVRRVSGPNPVRVVLDPRGRLPESLRIFRDGAAPTLHLVGEESADGGGGVETTAGAERAAPVGGEGEAGPHSPEAPGVERILLPVGDDGRFEPHAVIDLLASRGLTRVLVEGGGLTVSHFLEAGALDRLHITVAPLLMGSGRPGLTLPPIRRMDGALRPPTRRFQLGGDVLFDLDLRSGGDSESLPDPHD